ncbi:MFS transporter [Compostimonas suwonensis]|uniref:EmrB/QacA subfamily drug resistance transporter n=1 Tax=Compostimonas suwonensis TaxID=1048394 RepID=A0A2M9BWW4_9MICO|nr:MFS transporter [Compostimonas suwonensis]PJJ62424.1 EmrB/QacA subfamily drug resistance transporter [Compostimonas suwonensis]
MADPTAAPSPDRVRWQAFGVCVGVAALTILDLSKVNVGLPSIEKSLGAGPTELQLIVAGYALAFGLALVPSGRLGDIHSRRTLFIVGLSAFTAASLLCALAPNITVLVVARILQGIAAGIQMPQVLGLIQQLFQGAARGRAFGVFGATVGVATAFGPTLGGLLIAVGGPTDGWRLLFWMNIPLGLIAIFFAMRLLPKRQAHDRGRTELDLIGILLLGITTFSLMLPFVLTTGGPDDDPNRWWWLVGFALGAAAFVWWERDYKRRGKSPVIHFSLFALSSYRNGILVATAYFAAIPAVFLLTTLYLQQGLGLAPVFAGMVSIPFALASAVTAWIGGRLVERYGRALVVLGLVLVIVGFLLVLAAAVLSPRELTPWLMAAAMTVAGAGGGFVISPNQTLTLAEIPVTEGGVAGSMAQVGQRVGTAIGVAAASSTFFATLYRESAASDQLAVYHDGVRNGFTVAIGLMAVALVLGLVDLGQRRRRQKTGRPEPTA